MNARDPSGMASCKSLDAGIGYTCDYTGNEDSDSQQYPDEIPVDPETGDPSVFSDGGSSSNQSQWSTDYFTIEIGIAARLFRKIPFTDFVVEMNVDKYGNMYLGAGLAFGMSKGDMSAKVTAGDVYGWPGAPESVTNTALSGFEINGNAGFIVGGTVAGAGPGNTISREVGAMTPQVNFGGNYSVDTGAQAPGWLMSWLFR